MHACWGRALASMADVHWAVVKSLMAGCHPPLCCCMCNPHHMWYAEVQSALFTFIIPGFRGSANPSFLQHCLTYTSQCCVSRAIRAASDNGVSTAALARMLANPASQDITTAVAASQPAAGSATPATAVAAAGTTAGPSRPMSASSPDSNDDDDDESGVEPDALSHAHAVLELLTRYGLVRNARSIG